MIAKKLRAVATALVLGTAAVAAAGVLTTTPAEAAVRAVVGKPLQAALAAAQAGNYSAAMAHVREAESAGGLSAEERKVVDQTRQYIEVKSGGSVGVSTPTAAQAKFDSDYRSGRFRDAINDEALLRRYGLLNGTNMVIIAQAYYRMGSYRDCAHYADAHSSAGADMLDLQARCAYEAHDDALMRSALEQLVAVRGTPENWSRLLKLAESSKGLSDPQTLDIYRIKYLTGAMKGADDYFTLAQLLIAARLPSEAVSVMEKGMQAHVLVDARAGRLLALAKQNQAADMAGLAKRAAAAAKEPKGDDLVQLGEDYCGMGKYTDAIAAIKDGIDKGVRDRDDAEIRLGMAYYGAGQKPAALASFAKVKTSPNSEMTSKLWSLYVRGH